MLGGATAIMTARMRVIEKITLSTKQPYHAGDAEGVMEFSGVRRTSSELDGVKAPHL